MRDGAFLITGGSSGIGAEMAAAIASVGRRVGVVSRQKPGALAAFAALAKAGSVDWVRADLRAAETLSAAVRKWAESVNGAVDGLVLSAVSYGHGGRHLLQETELAEWDEIMEVNLRSTFVLLSAMLPLLVARPRALIVGVSSSAAVEPAPGRASYAASKAGSLAVLRALAEELRSTNVSVVQVMPRNQVVTPGLRARRPVGFSFEGYDSPTIFRPFILDAVSTMGRARHGELIVVDGDGQWRSL